MVDINKEVMEAAFTDVEHEFVSATSKHGKFNSAHEGWAVLYEEVDELWEHVRLKSSKRNKREMREECVQIAAMALRFIHDVCAE